jgi:hypothetical protein
MDPAFLLFRKGNSVGIDIYLSWPKMTKKQKEAQRVGFSVYDGNTGYLREAYHGAPYPSKILVREAFESKTNKAKIPASLMRERLTHVTEPARGVGINAAVMNEVIKKIAEMVDKEKPEGALGRFGVLHVDPGTFPPEKLDNDAMTVEEAVIKRCQINYPEMQPEEVARMLQSYRDFVDLAEQMEKKTGKPCTVYTSY